MLFRKARFPRLLEVALPVVVLFVVSCASTDISLNSTGKKKKKKKCKLREVLREQGFENYTNKERRDFTSILILIFQHPNSQI